MGGIVLKQDVVELYSMHFTQELILWEKEKEMVPLFGEGKSILTQEKECWAYLPVVLMLSEMLWQIK